MLYICYLRTSLTEYQRTIFIDLYIKILKSNDYCNQGYYNAEAVMLFSVYKGNGKYLTAVV